jgi:hypothetical protein
MNRNGLWLTQTTTIGSGVSTVTVSGAFSNVYSAHLIVVQGGVGSTTQNIGLRLGSITTGYYGGQIAVNTSGTVTGSGMNNTANWTLAGNSTTTNNYMYAIVHNAAETKQKQLFASHVDDRTTGTFGVVAGYMTNTSSQSAFTLIVSGTMTGGEIRVYGMKKNA